MIDARLTRREHPSPRRSVRACQCRKAGSDAPADAVGRSETGRRRDQPCFGPVIVAVVVLSGVLEQAGLIRARKLARHVFWSVDAAGMAAPISILLNDGCMEHPEEMASCRHGQTVAAPDIAPAAMTPTTAPQES